MIYSAAYLFDLATRMLESGTSSIDVAAHLVDVCKIDDDIATKIVSVAFDPCEASMQIANVVDYFANA